MMLGNSIVEVVTRWCGRRTTLLLWAGGFFSAAMIGVGVAEAFIPALILLLIAGVAMGVQMPVRQAFVHQIVPTEQRATVVSFDSMISGGGGVVAQAGLGAFAERAGYSAGYIAGGAATLVALPLLALVRRHQDPEDFFEGTRPAEGSACAIDGLPSIAAVEGHLPVDAAS